MTFDLETGMHYCPCGGQPSYNFFVFLGRFVLHLSANIYQTRHVTLLVADAGLRAPSVPSLNFVGIPVRKIWRTSGGPSISQYGDRDLWPLTLKLVRIIARGVGNLPTNFGVSGTFRSPLIGQHLSEASLDLATLTFNLGGHGACRWYGFSYSICVPTLKFVGLPVRKIWAFTLRTLIGLVTLTFDFLTSK